VTSPTFNIGHRYRGTGVVVAHLDLYRLMDLSGEEPEMLADYLGPGKIAFVEWPPERESELAAACLAVTLSHAGGERRKIQVDVLTSEQAAR
jgi:tRNA threonylcarbamoyladenosine biosynthesis protein TsaE